MKKLFLLPLIALMMPAIFTTGCSNNHDPINIVKTLVKDNFDTKVISLGNVTSKEQAQTKLNEYFKDNEIKKNEVLFDCFNFLGAKNLRINDNQYTETSSSILDYLAKNICQMSCQYNIFFQDVKDNKFNFNLQGYVTIAYTSSLIFGKESSISKGDWIQYVFDIEGEETYCNLGLDGDDPTAPTKFDVNISYKLPSSSFTYTYGFIKGMHNGKDIQTMSITNMEEVNYAKHPYINGYYLVSTSFDCTY